MKKRLWKHFSLSGSYNYIHKLREIVQDYNKTWHSSIGMRPIDVNEKNSSIVRRYLYRKPQTIASNGKFKKGDFVRVSKYKHVFNKGYTPSWSTEIFVIIAEKSTVPPTYLLADYNGEKILGAFYEFELQKTRYKDDYLVEKIIKETKKKQFVKWLGFSDKYNSWIDK